MTDVNKLKFQLNDLHKIIIGVVAWCGMYFGLKSDLREYIALQKGVNDVQDLRIQNLEHKASESSMSYNPMSRDAVLPKEIKIEPQ